MVLFCCERNIHGYSGWGWWWKRTITSYDDSPIPTASRKKSCHQSSTLFQLVQIVFAPTNHYFSITICDNIALKIHVIHNLPHWNSHNFSKKSPFSMILSIIDYRQPTIPQVKSLENSRLICQSPLLIGIAMTRAMSL